MNYLAILFLITGLFLDFLTIKWAYDTAKNKMYKSGNILVPAVLYVIAIYLLDLNNKLLISFLLIVMHCLVYFCSGYFFEKIINKDNF